MKRLVVLAMLVLAVALWAQAPAGPALTLAAQTQYMWAQDFTNKEFSDRAVVAVGFTWVVDEFNTMFIGLHNESDAVLGDASSQHGGASAIGVANAWFGLNRAWFTTDLGKAFKLPVGVVAKMGFEEWKNKDFTKVFIREFEDQVGKGYKRWGGQLELMAMPELTLRTNWSWDAADKAAMIGGYGVVGPVAYEAAYYRHSGHDNPTDTLNDTGDWDLGLFEAGVLFKQDVTPEINLAVPASVNYDLFHSDADIVPVWVIVGGVRATYNKMVAAGFALKSQEESELNSGIVELWAKPMADKPVELIVIAGMGFDDDLYENMLDSVEATLKYTLGKSEWWFGLLWNSDLGKNLAKKLADFNIGGATSTTAIERTAIYMRGRVNF